MKIIDYIKDKLVPIFVSFILFMFILSLLILFKINELLIFFVMCIITLTYFFIFFYGYFKRKDFYKNFSNSLNKLDKKYLITEMVDNANFIEGKLMLDYLYQINKDMHEEINEFKNSTNDFKEYIEMWCHEIKTPIATSKLIVDNNSNKVTNSIGEELDRIEDYVEQVLYYSKTDNVNEDYIIKDINLKNSIDNVIKRNKKDLLRNKVKIEINNIDNVNSDSKWIEFIINQIVGNSVKYKSEEPFIRFETINNKNNVILNIIDNGIGISDNDINKVFIKGYTGDNGRSYSKSTGIGLFLCKKLCDKLGHDIIINKNEYNGVTISIIFPKSSMTNI